MPRTYFYLPVMVTAVAVSHHASRSYLEIDVWRRWLMSSIVNFQDSLPKLEINTWTFNSQSYYWNALSLPHNYPVWITSHLLTPTCFHHRSSSTAIITHWKTAFGLILRLIRCRTQIQEKNLGMVRRKTLADILLLWQVRQDVAGMSQHICKQQLTACSWAADSKHSQTFTDYYEIHIYLHSQGTGCRK